MAKIYNTKTHEIMWSDADIFCAIEDSFVELEAFLAAKRLDGHNMKD